MNDFTDPGDLGFFEEPNELIDEDALELINEFYEPFPGEDE